MNIYVANLNFKASSEDLEELFTQFGTVDSAKVINDRETGRSRGFGFVEMPNESEANEAIEKLNQTEHMTKVLSVSEARPKPERSNNSFGDRKPFKKY